MINLAAPIVIPKKDKINIEIERKFILRNLPDEARKHPVLSIEQWYKESDKGVIRYRATQDVKYPENEKFEKIIKLSVAKGINSEENFPIDKEQFYLDLDNDMRFIAKARYVVYCGQKFEIDVFNDFSLIMLEVELDNLDEKIMFPDWLQKEIIAEVTGMKEFSNYNLARTAAQDR